MTYRWFQWVGMILAIVFILWVVQQSAVVSYKCISLNDGKTTKASHNAKADSSVPSKADVNNDNNNNNNNDKNHTTSCLVPPLDPSDFASDLEFYKAVHESPFPSCAAGSWVYRPAEERVMLSSAHLQCLDRERQGNCHDPDAWKHTNDTAKLSRHNSLLIQAVRNSPGILNAFDPWVWESLTEPYQVMDRRDLKTYRARLRKIFLTTPPARIFFIGDSLTRQWQHAMKCELEHVVGMDPNSVAERIRYLQMHKGFEKRRLPFRNTTEQDYVVFNFGHHTGNKLGKNWPSKYAKILKEAFRIDYGNIPDQNIFFRTTTVRHFLKDQGDWNTDDSKAGGIAPDATAQWNWYGGNSPEQPKQNLLALDTILGEREPQRSFFGVDFFFKDHQFQVLDTSPMTLSRADSSFDGSHLCLPGPMDFWSRMLYHRMEVNQKKFRRHRRWKH